MTMKLIKIGLCAAGLLSTLSLQAFSYINTDSFVTLQGDGGVGQLIGEQATPWSAGAGYQWVMSEQMTLGVELNYLNNGSVTQGSTKLKSQALVPFASLYFYLTPNVNLFGKIGYGYQENKYTTTGGTSSTNKDFEPAGIGGVGYLIPFSKMVYLNAFIDATWMDQNNDTAADLVSNAGSVLKNMQYKVGLQLMF